MAKKSTFELRARLAPLLFADLHRIATLDGRSLNSVVGRLLEKAVRGYVVENRLADLTIEVERMTRGSPGRRARSA